MSDKMKMRDGDTVVLADTQPPSTRQPGFLRRAWITGGIVCLMLFLCGPARAFNGWEHKALSQLGLLLASNYVCVTFDSSTHTNNRLSDLRAIVSSFYEGLPETVEWRKPDSLPITYGEIALLADYMKDTYDMLHLPHSRVDLPTDAQTANLPYVRSLVEYGDKVLSLASASHGAYNHFQGRALDAFWSNHKLAVAAASETNLWGALMLSAYSVHFLQDLFAPGHVLTPRDANTHDLDAAILHDEFDDRGLMYVIAAPQQLAPLADAARAFVRSSAKPWRSPDAEPRHTLTLTDNAFDLFCDRLSGQSRVEVFCLGDGKLTASGQQQVLISIYTARAVADVLESYLRGVPTNSFPDYVWDRRAMGPWRSVELIDMRLPYGGLTCSNRVVTKSTSRVMASLEADNNSITNYPVIVSLMGPMYHNPGLSVTLGFESVSDFDGSHVRGLLEAEGLLGGGRSDIASGTEQLKARRFPKNLLPRDWGLTAGYSGVFGPDSQGHGGFARVIWPLASVNLQISLQVGGRYFWGEGVEGFTDFEMVRADWGLHILTIFVSAGHDYHSYANRGLQSGLALEAGISIALPWSKLKNLGSLTE